MNAATKPLLMLEAPRRRPSFVGLITPHEAAQRLGVSVDELDAMRTAGTGPIAFALTRRVVRYAPADVTAWRSRRVA
jgi:predicted DNA-binding transcriptional regulator AlpA